MHIFVRNVNEAFKKLVHGFKFHDIEGVRDQLRKSSSRNGDVVKAVYPTTITYMKPSERVLFNKARDCNPFFHLYEALWMLAGRNDIAPLAYYNSKMTDFSDDGVTQNGAYGYRWRTSNPIAKLVTVECGIGDYEEYQTTTTDQLTILINHLQSTPNSRRAVLSMWNVEDDLLKIDSSKDVCCNLSVKFSIREDLKPENPSSDIKYHYLDMTVFNRSNDLVWGALGANVVHFSILQEYMAAHIGCRVGVYNQIADDLHVYLNDKWTPDKWFPEDVDYYTSPLSRLSSTKMIGQPFPLVKHPAKFDEELIRFVEFNCGNIDPSELDEEPGWVEPFLKDVAQPLLHAFHCHKQRDYEAANYWLNRMPLGNDWRIAGVAWINKREEGWRSKQDV